MTRVCAGIMGIGLMLVILVGSAAPLQAKHLHAEKDYQELWCARAGGITEYVIEDGSRVDCLTDEYAVEFDFGPKWAEAIGQTLYYAIKTGKQPGIVLILEDEGERFEARLTAVALFYGIRTWVMRPRDLLLFYSSVLRRSAAL